MSEAHGKKKTLTGLLLGNLKERGHFEELVIDGRIILKFHVVLS
jgi:hypothetical protein